MNEKVSLGNGILAVKANGLKTAQALGGNETILIMQGGKFLQTTVSAFAALFGGYSRPEIEQIISAFLSQSLKPYDERLGNFVGDLSTITTHIGELAGLTTKEKSSIVKAINELVDNAGKVDLSVPAWKVFGNAAFGKYTNGMTVPKADSAYLQYREAFQNVLPPSYSQPAVGQNVSAKLAGTQTSQNITTVEVNQVLDVSILPSVTNFNDSPGLVDGPAPKPLSVTRKVGSAAVVEIGTTAPTADNGITIGDTVVYTSTYNFKGANVKTNDAGDPDSRGIFGQVTKSASVTITPRFKIFYGVLPSDVSLTSELIRGGNFIWENGSVPVSLNTGTANRRFFIAVRSATNRTLTVAKDVQTNGDVKSSYQDGKVTMSVKDGGGNNVNYDVYVYTQAVNYLEPHTHELTI